MIHVTVMGRFENLKHFFMHFTIEFVDFEKSGSQKGNAGIKEGGFDFLANPRLRSVVKGRNHAQGIQHGGADIDKSSSTGSPRVSILIGIPAHNAGCGMGDEIKTFSELVGAAFAEGRAGQENQLVVDL